MISDPTQKPCHSDRSGAKASGVEEPDFFRTARNDRRHSFTSHLAFFCLFALLASTACNRGPAQPSAANTSTAARRYAFSGKAISFDKNAGTANINNEPIPGFMDPMVMSYTIKPATMLNHLQPGDSITADVVVESGRYWL